MSKHTTGPLTVIKGGTLFIVQDKDGNDIAQVDFKGDAALFSAAPDLLAALEWCQTVYGSDWPENAQIRDTIKKAKGEI